MQLNPHLPEAVADLHGLLAHRPCLTTKTWPHFQTRLAGSLTGFFHFPSDAFGPALRTIV